MFGSDYSDITAIALCPFALLLGYSLVSSTYAVVATLVVVVLSVALVRGLPWLRAWAHCRGEGFTQNGPSVLDAIVALQTILLGGMVALTAYVQDSPRRQIGTVVLYVTLSTLPLAALLLISVIRTDGKNAYLYFDRGSVMIARWSLAICGALVLCVAGLCYAGWLPGQTPKPRQLHPAFYENYTFVNSNEPLGIAAKNEGAELFYVINPGLFEDQPYPNPVVIDISIDKPFTGWRAVDVEGLSSESLEGKRIRSKSQPIAIRNTDGGASVHWDDLESDKTYVLVVRLHRSATSRSAQSLFENLEERGNGVDVTIYYRPRLK